MSPVARITRPGTLGFPWAHTAVRPRRCRVVWLATTTSRMPSTLAAVSADVMEYLLLQYQDLFKDSTGLPLVHMRNHRIRFLPGMSAVTDGATLPCEQYIPQTTYGLGQIFTYDTTQLTHR
jgi:hypothetical protein